MSAALPLLFPVSGIQLGVAQAAIRKPNRDDVVVMVLDSRAEVAGVFTQNQYCAAPVIVCREHLAHTSSIKVLVINTGCANAATGKLGLENAKKTAEIVAQNTGCKPYEVLPFSTGVIMEHLPMDRLGAGIQQALRQVKEDNWAQAASAIMTTDTRPKGASAQLQIDGKTITITGISKGSGMIHPNMATMLGFIATDAPIAAPLLKTWVKKLADRSFNRITVDGDTSTNDSFVIISTGAGDIPLIQSEEDSRAHALWKTLEQVSIQLAQAIVRDGEGATKFISIQVDGAKDEGEAVNIAKSIAHSPLVKTAFYASDPNLGRIACAIGNSSAADLDIEQIDVYLDDVQVIQNGGRASDYQEADGQRVMNQSEMTIHVILKGRGQATTTVWTCDFSHEYVTINAEYRS